MSVSGRAVAIYITIYVNNLIRNELILNKYILCFDIPMLSYIAQHCYHFWFCIVHNRNSN